MQNDGDFFTENAQIIQEIINNTLARGLTVGFVLDHSVMCELYSQDAFWCANVLAAFWFASEHITSMKMALEITTSAIP